MSDTTPDIGKQQPADLEALQQQLEEIAAKAKRADKPDTKMHEDVQGPTIVVRGK